jgi:hypothetical protein
MFNIVFLQCLKDEVLLHVKINVIYREISKKKRPVT